MKEQEKRIQEEVEKTLHLLDNWESPNVNPFFYGKLANKLQDQEKESAGVLSIFLPKLTLATLMLLFVFNMITLVNTSTPTESNNINGLSNFAQQYNIISTE